MRELDSIGRRIPGKLDVTPRQFVIAVGREARRRLKESGIEPTEDSIASYVQNLKPGTPEHQFLMDGAYRMISAEYDGLRHLKIAEGNSPKEARRFADQEIRERYGRLDKNPERNYSFLDPILITD